MTPLEAKKLEMAEKKLGRMTSDMALTLAIEAEQTAKDCRPFDPAFAYFAEQQRQLENYALLLEADGR